MRQSLVIFDLKSQDICSILSILYSNKSIYTLLARNPPPICVGEDIIKLVEIEICVRIFDIDIGHKFHACFEILGRFMKFYTPAIKLGCVNTEIQREIDYVKNNATSYLLLLLHKKKTENFKSPIVIVV